MDKCRLNAIFENFIFIPPFFYFPLCTTCHSYGVDDVDNYHRYKYYTPTVLTFGF